MVSKIDNFIESMNKVSEYMTDTLRHSEVKYYYNFYKMGNNERVKIINLLKGLLIDSNYSNLSFNDLRDYNYFYYVILEVRDYVQFYLYKIEDDYYYVSIYIYIHSSDEGHYYSYRLDQMSELLRFLKILFN